MSCAPRSYRWVTKGAICPLCPVGTLPPCGIPAATRWAFPDNDSGARRGKWDKNTLLRNVNYLTTRALKTLNDAFAN